jgi:alkylation response protein AidB-like acyl-CoA dehydrogenase
MNISFTEVEQRFREEVRLWLKDNLAEFGHDRRSLPERRELNYRREWEDKLCAQGWACLSWPIEYGGKGLDAVRELIFWEEYARADAPAPFNSLGHGILGPTLIAYGTEEQKRRFLPPLLRNEEVWCQGYSEPNAGSDLASLRTEAVRQGDRYVVTGQKIWTSLAHVADWCFALVRTNRDVPKHRGISFLLIDLRDPKVEVRPIRQATGDAEFCEVFFNGVEVPIERRVGDEDGGWPIAMAAASFERGTYFIPRQIRLQQELNDLIALSRRRKIGSRAVIDDGNIRSRLVRLFMEATIMRLHSYRVVSETSEGQPPGPIASYTKLFWSETHQRLAELAIEIAGEGEVLGGTGHERNDSARWQREYLWTRAETILAGTSEIQRNIIAERTLDLPR